MKYGRETPIATDPMTSRKPYPYPKVIPATHIEGLEGKSRIGNNATEPKTISASTCLLNVSVSQLIMGIISWRKDEMQLESNMTRWEP